MAKERHRATPAVYLILKKDNKVLMHLRCGTGYMDNHYSLVAGHVEAEELPTACLIREAKEEAGVIVKEEDLQFAHVMYRAQKNDERVDFFYVCEKWKGKIQNLEPNKCGGLEFFDIKNLPINTIPYVKKVIENVVDKVYFSEY